MNQRKRQLAKKVAFVRSPLGRKLVEARKAIREHLLRLAGQPMDKIKVGIIESISIRRSTPCRHPMHRASKRKLVTQHLLCTATVGAPIRTHNLEFTVQR